MGIKFEVRRVTDANLQLLWNNTILRLDTAVDIAHLVTKGTDDPCVHWVIKQPTTGSIAVWSTNISMLHVAGADIPAVLSMYPLLGVRVPTMDMVMEIVKMLDRDAVFKLLSSAIDT
jgi:hypothetical protein